MSNVVNLAEQRERWTLASETPDGLLKVWVSSFGRARIERGEYTTILELTDFAIFTYNLSCALNTVVK